MAMDSRKMRSSINDLKRERTAIRQKTDSIGETGERLAADKEELDNARRFIQSMDMPGEEKAKALARLDQQQRVLERTFERDVDKPGEEQDKKMDGLAKEAQNYSDAARRNREKLDGFRRRSNMDDSALKTAAKEQKKLSIDYKAEGQTIERERRETTEDRSGLGRKIGKISRGVAIGVVAGLTIVTDFYRAYTSVDQIKKHNNESGAVDAIHTAPTDKRKALGDLAKLYYDTLDEWKDAEEERDKAKERRRRAAISRGSGYGEYTDPPKRPSAPVRAAEYEQFERRLIEQSMQRFIEEQGLDPKQIKIVFRQ